MRRKLGAIAGAALVILIALAVASASPGYQLIVTAEDGHVLWRVPVGLGTPVVLAYTNSIYRAPTEERLLVTAAGFVLTEVRSTSEAVLSYNALPPPYTRQGTFVAATTHVSLPAQLAMRIGRTGRQRLIIGGRTVPLFAAGIGAGVTVEIARRSLLASWVPWP